VCKYYCRGSWRRGWWRGLSNSALFLLMSNKPNTSKALISAAAEKYSEKSRLRAAIQLIPYVGGPLDALIGGEGQKIQQRRLAHFIDELDIWLRKIEAPQHALADEELFDLMVGTFERVSKTPSEEKRARFAQIVANEIAHVKEIDEAETAIRLVSELDDLHIPVLNIAIHAPLGSGTFGQVRVVAISPQIKTQFISGTSHAPLKASLPEIPEHILSLTCSE
jgi:hypothetical protein